MTNFVLCIHVQIRFASTEKTTRIASRASCYLYRDRLFLKVKQMVNTLKTLIIVCFEYILFT